MLSPATAGRAVHVDRIPRVIGTRCGVNSTCTGVPATWVSACSISPVWRWVSSP